MKTAVIRARCTPELKARVLAYAERMGLEEADIIRIAVQDYINRADSAPAGQAQITLHPAPAVSYLPTHTDAPQLNDRPPGRSQKPKRRSP